MMHAGLTAGAHSAGRQADEVLQDGVAHREVAEVDPLYQMLDLPLASARAAPRLPRVAARKAASTSWVGDTAWAKGRLQSDRPAPAQRQPSRPPSAQGHRPGDRCVIRH
jgi:hypothetical protein